MKNSIIVKNLYGYPAANSTIEDITSRFQLEPVFGLSNLKNKSKNILVVASITQLDAIGIPILGYRSSSKGGWIKSTLPKALKPNILEFTPPKERFPTSDAVAKYMKSNSLDHIEDGVYKKYHMKPPKDTTGPVK